MIVVLWVSFEHPTECPFPNAALMHAWSRQHEKLPSLALIKNTSLLAVLLSLLQKVQVCSPLIESQTFVFSPQTEMGHFLFISMLYLFISQTLTSLYVPLTFWVSFLSGSFPLGHLETLHQCKYTDLLSFLKPIHSLLWQETNYHVQHQ